MHLVLADIGPAVLHIEERHTHPEWLDQVSARFDAIKDGKSPALCRIPNPKK
jgi:hypothetical protein